MTIHLTGEETKLLEFSKWWRQHLNTDLSASKAYAINQRLANYSQTWPCCLFLQILCRNASTLIHLHIVYRCFHAKTAELQACDRPTVACKVKTIYHLALCRKFVNFSFNETFFHLYVLPPHI